MATADEQIRISDRIKKRLDSRRREGESYNDVLDRLLGETTDSDFEDGFGLLSAADGQWLREQRADAKDGRKEHRRRQSLGAGTSTEYPSSAATMSPSKTDSASASISARSG